MSKAASYEISDGSFAGAGSAFPFGAWIFESILATASAIGVVESTFCS